MIKNSIFFLLLLSLTVHSQISISNLMEYQLGNLPYKQPENPSTLYDLLKISYLYDNFYASIEAQQFQSSFKAREYQEISRKFLRYQNENWELTLGNFYQIFGRGLILRSYNIPGSILEDQVYRSRYSFFRDLEGIALQYYGKWLNLKAIRGRPLQNDLPPTFDKERRRRDLLEGAETVFLIPGGWKLGGAYLRNNIEDKNTSYGALSIDGHLPANITVYGEFAQQLGRGHSFFDFSDTSTQALYLSVNSVVGPIGMSAEYKDYHNFNLLFNDPPPLIKEHEYTLLNRKTHILNARNESGWQVEAFYTTAGGHSLTANISEAKNKFSTSNFLFKEVFFEFVLMPGLNQSVKFFYDLSKESSLREIDRKTVGIYWEQLWTGNWGSTFDLEYQSFKRDFTVIQNINNFLTTFSISYAPKLSAGIILERSNDPQDTDNPTTTKIETNPRHWMGLTFAYQANRSHSINVFYGKRRGGPACTSGICYEVLDFEGFEFRLSSIF